MPIKDALSPTQPESIEPLNVTSLNAADFVFHHKVCCIFIDPLPRCRSPPCRLNFLKNSDEMEEPLMWQRNNGRGEANILQNQFTAYLVTAIHWQKITYLRKYSKLKKRESPTDFDNLFAHTLDSMVENTFSVEQPVLESITLAQALSKISDRERYILLARVLEERSFEDLASELGIGYKGAAALYYRTIQKMKRKM